MDFDKILSKLKKGEYVDYNEDLVIRLFQDGHDLNYDTPYFGHHVSHFFRDEHPFKDINEMKEEIRRSAKFLKHNRIRFGYWFYNEEELPDKQVEVFID